MLLMLPLSTIFFARYFSSRRALLCQRRCYAAADAYATLLMPRFAFHCCFLQLFSRCHTRYAATPRHVDALLRFFSCHTLLMLLR